ncbi:hypothetical protein KJ567_01190, partial [Candidatus Bipolaricaulota bacterium]|nr:hypothetical protein [Candidatus Bipolaricaulota bacterium]
MRRFAAAIVMACALWVPAALAQQPILEFSVLPQPIRIPTGGRAVLLVGIENRSIYDADDIEAVWTMGEGLGFVEDVEPIELVPPFETARLEAILVADPALEPGVVEASIDIVYSYCIGELCFQFAEPLQVEVVVEAATGEPVDVIPLPSDPAATFPWPWAAVSVGLFVLMSTAALRRFSRASWSVVLVVIVVAVGGLAYGVFEHQHEQAQGIAA